MLFSPTIDPATTAEAPRGDSSPPGLRHVRQRNGRDCGVAAAAILAGVTYDRAARAHPDARPADGLQAMEVAIMLRHLTGRLVRLSGAAEGEALAHCAPSLPDPAIALIHAPDSTRGHYVVLAAGQVLDPELPDAQVPQDYIHRDWTVFRVLTLED
ncbi:MAG TPA: hypothetical protein VF832_14805 [Longimicrobiales bacterium]